MSTELANPPSATPAPEAGSPNEPASTRTTESAVDPMGNPEPIPNNETDTVVPDNPEPVDWSKVVSPDGEFDSLAHEQLGIPEQFKNIPGMLKSYQELQRMKAAPGPDATPEEIERFRQGNLIPKEATAESYGLIVPDELKEYVPAESLDRIAKAANENAHLGHVGVMKAVVDEFGKIEVEAMAAAQESSQAEERQRLQAASEYLGKDPAFAGDSRKGALETVSNGLNAALGALGVAGDAPEAVALRDFARENPLITRVLHHFASKTGQDGMPGAGAQQDLRSREQLAEAIQTDPNDPLYEAFHDESHPQHEDAKRIYWGHMGVSQ